MESSLQARLLLIGEHNMYSHTQKKTQTLILSSSVISNCTRSSSYICKHFVIRKGITVLLAGFMLWYALQQESML